MIKITPKIRELILHILSLPITSFEIHFLNSILASGSYDANDRIYLNNIRRNYYDELLVIYRSTDNDNFLDVEAELTSMLSAQIAHEIDNQIIENIKKQAWKL